MDWCKNKEQLKQDRQELEGWWLKQNITPRTSKSGKGYYITHWNVYRYETNYHDIYNNDHPLPTSLQEDIEDMKFQLTRTNINGGKRLRRPKTRKNRSRK